MIGTKITAAEGKVFRRISDGIFFGNEIYLGMAYPKNGEPYEEIPEHFEEIDAPTETETIVLDEATPLIGDVPETTVLSGDQEAKSEATVKRVVTMSDYRELEKKVELLLKLVYSN